MNLRLLATEVGDLVKWDTSVNEIERAGKAVFPFNRDTFPNDAITSARAQQVYDWIMTAGATSLDAGERVRLLRQFCETIAPAEQTERVQTVLARALSEGDESAASRREFDSYAFHGEVRTHCRRLFCQGNYFHAVFEACKAYNKAVRMKSRSNKDGQALMMQVWPPSGTLKLTPCETETEKSVQDGVKFLSAGLMSAMRNPTSHEPALHWPIEKQDCLDMLGFVSFLFRKLDSAVYFNPSQGSAR